MCMHTHTHFACPQSLYYIKYSAFCCCCYCCHFPELASALSFALHFLFCEFIFFAVFIIFSSISLNLGAFVMLCCASFLCWWHRRHHWRCLHTMAKSCSSPLFLSIFPLFIHFIFMAVQWHNNNAHSWIFYLLIKIYNINKFEWCQNRI